MSTKKIFITGGTGCIGHYVIDRFIANPNYELHLLLRDPKRLRFDYLKHSNIHLHLGDMAHIETFADVLKEMNIVIHIATEWGASEHTKTINVKKTHQLFSYCDHAQCEKILYFSTASILGKNNQPLKEAGVCGTYYIQSKYEGYGDIKNSPVKEKIITLFPTLVFGGDSCHPYSHISQGLIPNLHYAKILRFFYMNASFHFLHAKDIAIVTEYVITHPITSQNLVLGNEVITGKNAIETICRFFQIPIYFRIKIVPLLVFFLTKLAKIKLHPWDRFCIKHPFFQYNVVNPATYGLNAAFPTLESVLKECQKQAQK